MVKMYGIHGKNAWNPCENAWNPHENAWNPPGIAWNPCGNAWNPCGIHGIEPFHVDSTWNVGAQ